IEADSGIVAMHKEQGNLPDNVDLRHEDILKTDLVGLVKETGNKLKIVANLPYSISSPFIFTLIEYSEAVAYAVVMLQKEVAQRLMAKSDTKAYGAPTVLLASCADVQPLLSVSPNEFHPRPKVDSLVMKITFSPPSERIKQLADFDKTMLRRVVNGAFGQRRKTLLNSLSSTFTHGGKIAMAQIIEQAGIPPGIRAEKLELPDFIALSNALKAKKEATTL
ncbi:MAG: ribosomal RNA small subunit methyltransferase A, partial [Desulfobulbus propionicus]